MTPLELLTWVATICLAVILVMITLGVVVEVIRMSAKRKPKPEKTKPPTPVTSLPSLGLVEEAQKNRQTKQPVKRR